MSNHFVQKIASVVLILGIFVSIFMAAQTARAQVPSGIPFGGRIVKYVPPTLICPFSHSIILDYVTGNTFAVALLPPPASTMYEKYNFTIEGTYLLGTYLLPPLICPLPYPILPIVQVGTS